MISVYTTGFNLSKINVDFDDVFSNWFCYANQIVIATFEEQREETINEICKSKFYDKHKIAVIPFAVDIENDIYWEGKLKNAALASCYNDVFIQCDLDERISGQPSDFYLMAREIMKHDFSCSIMLPTIDLYEDLDHYITIGHKWYIHRKKGCFRGSVNFARKEDGNLDAKQSDTCELIDNAGNLIPCIGKIDYNIDTPKIIHLGYLDLQERNRVNKFWGKVWNHRLTGDFDSKYEMEKTTSGDPRKNKHNLKHPLWPKIK